MRLLLLLCCVALLWLAPSAADACGATPPSFTLLTDDAGNVPAGTRVLRLYVYGSSTQPKPPTVTLTVHGGGLPVVVPVTLRVAAPWLVEVDLGGAPVQAQVSYRLTVAGVESEEASNSGYSAVLPFAGVAASPLPSELGVLQLEGRTSGAHSTGGCGQKMESEQALIKLVPSSAAEPWLRAVSHQLVMDGQPMFAPEIPLVDYVARKNPTLIRALAPCARAPSGVDGAFAPSIELQVPAGKHSVKWISTLANGTVLETPPLAVDLTCGATSTAVTPPCCKPLVSDAGAGSATGTNPSMVAPGPPSGAPGTNAGAPDAAAAAVAGDAVQAGRSDSFVVEDGAESEGCTLAGATHGDASLWGVLVALLMLRIRRARRALPGRS